MLIGSLELPLSTAISCRVDDGGIDEREHCNESEHAGHDEGTVAASRGEVEECRGDDADVDRVFELLGGQS